ncbi:isoeugenol synthase 1-like [Hibiscus syriacus]|uniref:isoeugenol synthase 1-like n=1 Tax=Hibiscus syriacus TaxID=106335 RepID=UPI0019234A84|nr:isoeugenol synthase 1-like [Hibiscus syriacus]
MDKQANGYGGAEETKSKILIFGGSGTAYLGTYMVKASIKSGHRTFVYARPITPRSFQHKIDLHDEFRSLGVTVIEGELDEHEKIVATLVLK